MKKKKPSDKVLVKVKLSVEEQAKLAGLARLAGKTPSELIEELIEKKYQKWLTNRGLKNA